MAESTGVGTATGTGTGDLTTTHWVAMALAAVTGVVHLGLGLGNLGGDLGVPFVLAGLGFFGGIVLFYLDYRRRLLYLVGIVFTGVQVPLYFAFNWPNVVSVSGLADKLIQVVLVVLLFQLYRQSAGSETLG